MQETLVTFRHATLHCNACTCSSPGRGLCNLLIAPPRHTRLTEFRTEIRRATRTGREDKRRGRDQVSELGIAWVRKQKATSCQVAGDGRGQWAMQCFTPLLVVPWSDGTGHRTSDKHEHETSGPTWKAVISNLLIQRKSDWRVFREGARKAYQRIALRLLTMLQRQEYRTVPAITQGATMVVLDHDSSLLNHIINFRLDELQQHANGLFARTFKLHGDTANGSNLGGVMRKYLPNTAKPSSNRRNPAGWCLHETRSRTGVRDTDARQITTCNTQQ